LIGIHKFSRIAFEELTITSSIINRSNPADAEDGYSSSIGNVAWMLVASSSICILAFAVLIFGISFLSPTTVKMRIDHSLSADQAINFPLDRISEILLRLRFIGFALSSCPVLILAFSSWMRQYVVGLLAPLPMMIRDVRRRASDFVLRERLQFFSILMLTLHAALVRVAFLSQPMRCDESDTYNVLSSRSLIEGLSVYHSPNNHVLFTLLSHLCTHWLGGNPWAIRLPAFVAGVLIVPFSYVAVRSLFGCIAALLSAALLSSSAYLILYSVNGRGYSLQGLLTLVEVIICVYIIKTQFRSAWPLFALVGALGFFTVPTMLYPFSMCFFWLALMVFTGGPQFERQKLFIDLGVGTVLLLYLTLILYTPVLIVSGPMKLFANRFVAPLPWADFLPLLWSRLVEFEEFARTSVPFAAWMCLAVGFVWTIVSNRLVARHKVSIVLTAFASAAAILLVQRAAPFSRVWQWFLPLYFGAATAGLLELFLRVIRNRSVQIAVAFGAIIVVCIASDYSIIKYRSPSHFADTEEFDDGLQIALYLKNNMQPNDRTLITYPGYPVVSYYLRRLGAPANILSKKDGLWTLAVVDVPLDEFNERLSYGGMPGLSEGRLKVEFKTGHCIVYRIKQVD
jgi:hypothetical protein